MFKALLKIFKFFFVLLCWSFVWLSAMRLVMLYVWNFDIFSVTSWQMIWLYWNANGIIKDPKDYMLFVTIFIVVIIWYKGLKRFYRIDFKELILKPFNYFSKRQIEKYKNESKHVAIKNLVIGEKLTVDDLIEEKIKEEGNRQSQKESDSLRENISKKITERKGQ